MPMRGGDDPQAVDDARERHTRTLLAHMALAMEAGNYDAVSKAWHDMDDEPSAQEYVFMACLHLLTLSSRVAQALVTDHIMVIDMRDMDENED